MVAGTAVTGRTVNAPASNMARINNPGLIRIFRASGDKRFMMILPYIDTVRVLFKIHGEVFDLIILSNPRSAAPSMDHLG
jgi:hypothetical protein